MRQQMHEWCEREQYRAEEAMERRILTPRNVGYFWGVITGWAACDLLWRLWT